MMPTMLNGIKPESFPDTTSFIITNPGDNSTTDFSRLLIYEKDCLEHSAPPLQIVPNIKPGLTNIPTCQPLHVVPINPNTMLPVTSNQHVDHMQQDRNLSQPIFALGSSAFRPRCSAAPSVPSTHHSEDHYIGEGSTGNSSSSNKPSEACFVRILLPQCKRLAPLWFRSVSTMREKNRGEQRKPSQTQDDWTDISDCVSHMDPNEEADSVVNLLKKLYKELPGDSVCWLMKCWLNDLEADSDPERCVISRGDAKMRMRRIDCGKGSDKVWRLDTIVGMLFHGLPMSSTDTYMMIHTCKNDLCVRPQHLRFRANSVSLVVVLKALAQAGFVISKAEPGITSVATPVGRNEFVDVFGPFSIDQLQQYRSETLQPRGNLLSRLVLNDSDFKFIQGVDSLREAFNESYPPNAGGSHLGSVSGAQGKASTSMTAAIRSHRKSILDEPCVGRKSVKRLASPTAALSPGQEFNTDSSPSVGSFAAVLEHSPPKQICQGLMGDQVDGNNKRQSPALGITPRQPAKKRIEARTPIDEKPSANQSPMDQNKPPLVLGNLTGCYPYSSEDNFPGLRNADLEDEEELVMIHQDQSHSEAGMIPQLTTPRKSASAEPKSRNEQLAAIYAMMRGQASQINAVNNGLSSKSFSFIGLPKLGGSPTRSSPSISPNGRANIDLFSQHQQSDSIQVLQLLSSRTQQSPELMELYQSIQGQHGGLYRGDKNQLADVPGKFYERLLKSPYSRSPLIKSVAQLRGLTPIPVELDSFMYRGTPDLTNPSPILTALTAAVSSMDMPMPKLEQHSPTSIGRLTPPK